MKFAKVRKVKDPVRAHSNDAGIDFFIPEDLNAHEFESKQPVDSDSYLYVSDVHDCIETITVFPNGRVLIPSGIHVRLDEGTALVFMNKSGVAHKLGLIVGSAVVDENYTGEVHLSLINTSNKAIALNAGQKIVQGLIWCVSYSVPTEQESLDLLYHNHESDRGDGGFGHTGDS